MRVGLKARKCETCGKPKGVFAFAGKYYHPGCFMKTKHTLTLGRDVKKQEVKK